MGEMDDIIKEFLVESNDNLDQLDSGLVELEKDPYSQELLGSIFRAIHTVKGTSGVLGFPKLEAVAHAGENLLSKLRDGKLHLNLEITSGLLKMVDAIREILQRIENTGAEGDGNYTAVSELLNSLLEAELAKAEKTSETQSKLLGEILTEKLNVPQDAIDSALAQQAAGDPRKIGEILVEQGHVASRAVLDALKTQAEAAPQLSASSIRVDVNLLDKLMNLVGELVLARNQILQFTSTLKESAFLGTAQRLNLITTELQEGVMKTRMQPIGSVWHKFPRVVRDLSVQFGKQVRIEMEGSETELDKTIIEAIKDPLTHIIRNAIDHGIELPRERTAAGKAAEGRVSLRAFHEGGQVNIEVADDGGGIHLERLKQKAIERGQITPEQAARMSERESLNLVFLPGLSTAAKVTNVSGRGVGMDVVKTNIEKIGGTVDVHSVEAEGTTLKIKIPLTLAIIPALVATSGGERFAIPQVSLLELVRLEGEEAV
ncbi:MAG: chemotaxis protein CheA [Terriglobales bacterium]